MYIKICDSFTKMITKIKYIKNKYNPEPSLYNNVR